ncbi:MAG: arsenate reductase ArsC [Pirellulaceae bacterium]|nr:arsenate reductase ArsC [Planctomycetota bacterium]
MNPARVLILCTGNSCRSQMAEGLWNALSQGKWQCVSAGSKPAGYVHPQAIQVMHERDIDLSANTSKHLDEFAADSFDYAVTVCDHADQSCPVIGNANQRLHWPFPDPAEVCGSEEENLVVFREVRDAIEAKIREFMASLSVQENG